MAQVNASVDGPEIDPSMGEIKLVPIGYREDVLAVAAHDRTLPGTEESEIGSITHRIIDQALLELNIDERLVVESRFGFNGSAETLAEIGAQLGISPQEASKIGRSGLEKIEEVLRASGLDPTAGTDGYTDEQPALTWTPKQLSLQARWQRNVRARRGEARRDEPEWTPEQRALQEQWFDEIRSKQEDGDIAFVRGSLLKEPLPEEVEEYLADFRYNGERDGAGLRAALQAVKERRDPEASRLAKMGISTRKANRLHNRVVSLEKKLAATKEEFEEALAEGAEAIKESGLYAEE